MSLKYKFYLLIAIGIVFSSCSVTRRIRKADKAYELGNYYDASKKYVSARKHIPSKKRTLRAKVYYQIGQCNRYLNRPERSEPAYKSAIKYHYPDSTMYLYLATAQMQREKYKDAIENYQLYLSWKPNSSAAKNRLAACQAINTMKQNKTRYKVSFAKEFKSRRNSSNSSPMFVGDDYTQLVFASNRPGDNSTKRSLITGVPNNDLYYMSKNKSGTWSKPEPLSENINTLGDEGTPAFNSAGKQLYYTSCSDDFDPARVFMSARSGGEWTNPVAITLFKDSSITVAHPTMSPDGSTLYFVSDAPGGYGGKDIWYSKKDEGKWSVPFNMGPEINTSGDEMFPYFRNDSTFYFSSNGHSGFGGLDIFKATIDSIGEWKVVNMMQPVNSQYDDYGITFEGKDEKGFFTSNRQKRKLIDAIFRFELPEMVFAISGKVLNDRGELLNDGYIRLVGDNGDNVRIPVRKDGTYRINLSRNTKYVMLASDRGYLNQSYKFTTQNLDDSKLYENDFTLAPISRPVKMENIFYDFAKWTLTPNSKTGLDALIKILNDNPNVAIELSAHTDYVGSEESNRILSQKRAESVVNYLIKAGIEAGRLTPKGYGENKPVVIDASLAKQYSYLKVGDELTEQFIMTLTKQQQEVCNQINRRTEFKVSKTTYNLY